MNKDLYKITPDDIKDLKAACNYPPPETITVCDKCLQASCWQGIFMCDLAQNAGTVEKTREELTALALEHPDYWRKPCSYCGDPTHTEEAETCPQRAKDADRFVEKGREF